MRKRFKIAGRCLADRHYMLTALMAEFQRLWRENSESHYEDYCYREALPHLDETCSGKGIHAIGL